MDLRFHLAPHDFPFPLTKAQAGGKETASEKAGKAALHPVVMEEGQHAINPPGDGQHKPDYGAPHGLRLAARHSFKAADTLSNMWRRHILAL
jgi:hypothetical protein